MKFEPVAEPLAPRGAGCGRRPQWKVITHIREAVRPPTSRSTRSFISFAARLVNVIARISPGAATPAVDQVRDAVREHARLARAGAGDDEQRPLGVLDRFTLLRVERVEQCVGGGARRGHPTTADERRTAIGEALT